MATYTCANGHQSTTSDYCSECGKKLSGVQSGVAGPTGSASQSSAVGAEKCPDCDTPRASATAVFCEVCRYNFVTHQPWSPTSAGPIISAPAAVPAPVPAVAPIAASPIIEPPAPTVAPNLPSAPALRRWEAVVVVDPALYVDPDPAVPCPVGAPERVFPLDFAENLIGRRSERRAIFPEIDMSSDHGVSSRHAVIYREGDGSLTLLDVGSTNGTQLNGKDLPAGVRSPLNDGDQITLGCWTRLSIRPIALAGTNP